MNEGRKEIFQVVIVLVGIIFLVKLFFVQVADDRYAELADSNSILREVEYPFRGLIFDRHGKLIVYNTPEYDLEVIVNDVKSLDSLKFCLVFNLTLDELRKKFKELKSHKKEYSPVKPLRFIERLSNEEFAKVQDRLDEFPGFYIQARTTRSYTTKAMANALGYVSEISKGELKNDESKIYKQGDYIGQSGIEAFYEAQLRGKRGLRFKLRDVKGIEKGSFKDGKYDTLSVPGEDLVSSIDLDLQ